MSYESQEEADYFEGQAEQEQQAIADDDARGRAEAEAGTFEGEVKE